MCFNFYQFTQWCYWFKKKNIYIPPFEGFWSEPITSLKAKTIFIASSALDFSMAPNGVGWIFLEQWSDSSKLNNRFTQTGQSTLDQQQLFTWFWWWLLFRLLKHQSVLPKTVLLRTTLTWTIRLHNHSEVINDDHQENHFCFYLTGFLCMVVFLSQSLIHLFSYSLINMVSHYHCLKFVWAI